MPAIFCFLITCCICNFNLEVCGIHNWCKLTIIFLCAVSIAKIATS